MRARSNTFIIPPKTRNESTITKSKSNENETQSSRPRQTQEYDPFVSKPKLVHSPSKANTSQSSSCSEAADKESIQTPKRLFKNSLHEKSASFSHKSKRKLWSRGCIERLFDERKDVIHLLRDDLADTESPEDALKTSLGLLENLDDLENEEIKYREEQAIYWLIKAIERGNFEARLLLLNMVETDRGINSENMSDVRRVLNGSEDEILGNRLGETLYRNLTSNGRPIFPHNLTPNNSQGDWIKYDTSQEISKQSLIDSGQQFAQGRLPELDAKIIYSEKLSPTNAMIQSIYIIQRLVNNFQVILALLVSLCAYILQFSLKLHILLQLITIALLCLLALRAIYQLAEAKRFKRWKEIWGQSLTDTEYKEAEARFFSSRNLLTAFIVVSGLILSTYSFKSCSMMLWRLGAFSSILGRPKFNRWIVFLYTLPFIGLGIYIGEDRLIMNIFSWIDEKKVYITVTQSILSLFLIKQEGYANILPHLLIIAGLSTFAIEEISCFFGWIFFIPFTLLLSTNTTKQQKLVLIAAILFVCTASIIPNNSDETDGYIKLGMEEYSAICPSTIKCFELQGFQVGWRELQIKSVIQGEHQPLLIKWLLNSGSVRSENIKYILSLISSPYCDLIISNGDTLFGLGETLSTVVRTTKNCHEYKRGQTINVQGRIVFGESYQLLASFVAILS